MSVIGKTISHYAGFFAMLDEKKEALDWLENAVNRGFINYPLLSKKDPWARKHSRRGAVQEAHEAREERMGEF